MRHIPRFGLLAAAVLALPALGDVYHVPGDFDTIQAAINAGRHGDEIVVHPGRYVERIDFIGWNIWVHSSDGPEVTIIDGDDRGHVVMCISGETSDAVLEGFTITGGLGGGTGGGMLIRNSSPTVRGCVFTGNVARGDWDPATGGAISSHLSASTIINCKFTGNAAVSGLEDGLGGAIYSGESSLTITGCTFSANSAGGMHGGVGGAIAGDVGLVLTNCILWGNAPNEIYGEPEVRYSCVQEGYTGEGNIELDPLFVDPDGGDYRLLAGSPCIDAGDCAALPPDTHDLDGDGDTDEPIPYDLDGLARVVDDPGTGDTGNGFPCVDMGAYELQPGGCAADFNGDGVVDIRDLLAFLNAWAAGDTSADCNGDGSINTVDVLCFLNLWAAGC